MRIIAIISLLMLLLTGCATTKGGNEPAESSGAETTAIERAQPIGTVVLRDGSTMELTSFKKTAPHYLRITGKLNGRSSTLIQMTRVDDIRGWKGISFENPATFTIRTQEGKEHPFTDGQVFVGGESEESFTFMSIASGSSEEKESVVPKSEVKLIVFNPATSKR